MWRQAHYRAVVETAVDPIIVMDEHGLIQSANGAVDRVFGYAPSDIVGERLSLLVFVEGDAERDVLPTTPENGNGEPDLFGAGMRRSVTGLRRDGAHFAADLSVAGWTSDDGRRFFTAIVRDLSASRAAAAALRQSQEWLRTVTETALVGLLVVGEDERILFANATSAVLCGLSPRDLSHDSISNIFRGDVLASVRQHLACVLAGGRVTEQCSIPEPATGGPRHLSLTYEPSVSVDGDRVVVMVVTDITELKGREIKLEASRNLLQSVLDGTEDAIFAKDGEGRYLAINEAAARMLDKPREAFLDRTDAEIHGGVVAAQASAEDHEVMRTVQPQVFERTIRVAGEQRHYVVTKRPWGVADGTPQGIVGHARDVTAQRSAAQERREVAKRLVAAQEEERLRIARDLHDQVGQDLTALSLGLGAFEERFAATSDREAIAWLRGLTVEISRNLHRNVLQLRSTTLDDLGLSAAIASQVSDLGSRFGLDYDLHLDDIERCALDLDRQLAVFRAVQECLTNVLKHAAARSVTVVAQLDAGQLRIVVEDDGCGFDVDVPRRPIVGGGLGLLGVRERLNLVGGTVSVESVAGRGTSVFLELPAM